MTLFDGVFFVDRASGGLEFRPLPPPTDEEVGTHRNRLFMAASTSIYALDVNTQGCPGG